MEIKDLSVFHLEGWHLSSEASQDCQMYTSVVICSVVTSQCTDCPIITLECFLNLNASFISSHDFFFIPSTWLRAEPFSFGRAADAEPRRCRAKTSNVNKEKEKKQPYKFIFLYYFKHRWHASLKTHSWLCKDI